LTIIVERRPRRVLRSGKSTGSSPGDIKEFVRIRSRVKATAWFARDRGC